MVYVLAAALVALLVIVAVQGRLQVRLMDEHSKDRIRWAEERRELLNRIQAPHHIPFAPQHFEMPEQQPDDWNLVGTIRNDPEQYLAAQEPAADES